MLTPALEPCSTSECEAEERTFFVDLHADSLMWNRDIRVVRSNPIGHADFDRLVRGGIDIQVFGVPTHTPAPFSHSLEASCAKRSSLDTSNLVTLFNDTTRLDALTPRGRAYRQAERFRDWTANPKGHDVRAVFARGDLGVDATGKRDGTSNGLAVMLSLEGMHWVRGSRGQVFEEISHLKQLGYRMVALTHRFTNDLATGSEDCGIVLSPERGGGQKDEGLTGAGVHAVKAIAELDLILDLAHASDGTIEDVASVLKALPSGERPAVFMSHGGVQYGDAGSTKHEDGATKTWSCNFERNLTLQAIRNIVGLGGVIGVGYWPEALCYEADDWDDLKTEADREKLVFERMIVS